MMSNSTLKVPTPAFMPNNAVTTTLWIWGFILLIALLFSGVSFGQTVLTTPGTGAYTWTSPCDVTSITVEVWGGGGGGQRANGNPSAGGGGSGGGYVRTTYTVTPNTTYNLFVGTGGTGNSGGNGNASWFVNNTTILAVGGRGAGGAINANNTWGTGATAFNTGNIGGTLVTTYGGNGGNAGNNFSGGGGSSGGNTFNNATGITGGAAPINGYAGVNGRNSNGNGANGNIGAGGAGGRTAAGMDRNGGAGGRGQVRITYNTNLEAYCIPTLFEDVLPITSVNYAGIDNQTSNAVNGTPVVESFCETATVIVASSNTITVKGNTAGNFTDYYSVFIDWDQDGVFDSALNEIHNIGTITNSTGLDAQEIVYNISVPASAALGQTRMRVIKEDGFYTDPCGDFWGDINYGQAEDYVVNVTVCTGGNSTGTTALACPSVVTGGLGLNGADPAAVDCASSTCVELEANYLQLGDTSDYIVESIDYSPPYQFNCLANPVSVDLDDVWSPVVSLPFDFCFYDNTYNSVVIGSNGVISFNNALANGQTGWRIDNNIPSNTNGANGGNDYFYGPSIFGVHHDIDPNIGGQIGWELITLNTGCRALVAAWHDVPMYDQFSYNSILYSGMIVLYENTNVIEVYIEEKNLSQDLGGSTYWNNGRAQIGIQENATNGLGVTARNNIGVTWTTNQEAWRFIPDGASITTLRWYADSIDPANEIIDTNDDGVLEVCPNSTTNYFAEVTYNLCGGGTLVEVDQTTVTVNGGKVWNGSVSEHWNVAANWTPSGVPIDTDCIIIPDVPNAPLLSTTNGTIPIPPTPFGNGRNLTLLDGAYLELDEGTDLTVQDWVSVHSNAIFNLKNTSSLVQVLDVTTIPNTGNIHVQRAPKLDFSPVGNLNYVYWSSPVEDFNIQQVSPSTSGNLRWQWIPTVTGNGVGNHGEWQNASGTMVEGKGYIIRGLSGTPTFIPTTSYPVSNNTALFTGVPNNGEIIVPISRGTWTTGSGNYTGNGNTATVQDDNWNLLGNPYPSSISANEFVTLNTNINGTIYLWPHATLPSTANDDPFYDDFVYNYSNSYIEHNPTGTIPPIVGDVYIASGQSFMALMEDSSASTNETVIFNNSLREGSQPNTNFYRQSDNTSTNNNTAERHRIWLDLVRSNNQAHTLLVGYIENATNEVDRLYEGYSNIESTTSFYSLIDETTFSIQGRALPFSQEDMVPLGIKVSTNDIFKIGINMLDGLFENDSQNIFLEDTYLNTIHDLRNSPYVFSATSGTYNDRFILRYTNETLDVNDPEFNSGLNIISYNNEIKVTSTNNPINTIEVYDMLGRTIATYKDVNVTDFKFNLSNISNGTFIVKATLYNGQQKIKKIVN